MHYGITITLERPYERTLTGVREALAGQGSDIDRPGMEGEHRDLHARNRLVMPTQV